MLQINEQNAEVALEYWSTFNSV